jgi:hypothetical protein
MEPRPLVLVVGAVVVALVASGCSSDRDKAISFSSQLTCSATRNDLANLAWKAKQTLALVGRPEGYGVGIFGREFVFFEFAPTGQLASIKIASAAAVNEGRSGALMRPEDKEALLTCPVGQP